MVEFEIDVLGGRQQQPPSELSGIRLELQVIGGFQSSRLSMSWMTMSWV